MRLLAAAVCDRASVSPDGKLDLAGVFHDLYAPGFPAKQDRLMLVLSLEWDPEDEGRYSFRVHLKAPDGRPTLTVEGHSDVSPRPADRPPPRTRLAMPLQDVVFPVPGRYQFDVQAKGVELGGPALYVLEARAEDGEQDAEGRTPTRRSRSAGIEKPAGPI